MRRQLPSGRGRGPVPLDAATLETLALRYVGRYATSRAKLVTYLQRKLAERGWEGEVLPDPAGIADRCAALGYVDDRSFASARAASLGRRGFGTRRLAQALHAAGIAEDDGAEARAIAGASALPAALTLARRRRIGPYAASNPGPDEIRRAIAILVRGGHDFALARRIAAALPGEEIEAV